MLSSYSLIMNSYHVIHVIILQLPYELYHVIHVILQPPYHLNSLYHVIILQPVIITA